MSKPSDTALKHKTKVTVFGFDAAESSQIRRIRALMDAGYDVVAFTLRRRNMNPDFVPFWDNIHLATVENENLSRRAAVLVAALGKIARRLSRVRRADVLLARNFDLLLLAHAARLMALRHRVPVIYECLDVHTVFTDPSAKGRMFRWLERRLLARTQLVVVSSCGFSANYFRPVQGYRGPIYLMENKIWFTGSLPERRATSAPVGKGTAEVPFVLGWVGSLRCQPSFEILLGAAQRLGPTVRIAFHGNVHTHVLPNFEERISRHPTIAYHGPYTYPDGLDVYRGLDFVWAQDLWQRGANSDWLLPNRIYEASYFGCLSIAVAGTQTAKVVKDRGLGYVIDAPTAEALAALVETLDADEVRQRRNALLARPAEDFVSTPSDVEGMIDAAFVAHSNPNAHPALQSSDD